MFAEPSPAESRRPPARLLPKDDKRLMATAEIQRNIAAANDALSRFRSAWFEADPPHVRAAFEAAHDMIRAAEELRSSARELAYLTDPKAR